MTTTTPGTPTDGDSAATDQLPWQPRSGAELVPLLRPVMKAIAAAVGPHCEVVLHDLTKNPDRTIVAIENGHVTGRAVGGSLTNLGLEVMISEDRDVDALGYQSRTGDGRELRSSSVYFRNPAGDVVASLCLNFDLTMYQSVRGIMDDMLQFPGASNQGEIFATDIKDVLQTMIDEALAQARTPVATMTKADRLGVMQTLDGRGAFVVKSAVETVASRLKISRVTVYSYLDEIRSARTSG